MLKSDVIIKVHQHGALRDHELKFTVYILYIIFLIII